ncbi:MAG: response regulator [Bacteroidales bacterium]|nr:response regulator [Bacteroidales bacterium]
MTKPATILLVEDQRMDIELTLNAFREARLANSIRVATTGEEALHYLEGEGEFSDRQSHPLPDLILLDLKMPGIDGFEVLKMIKTTDKLKRIPVIVLTSSKEEGDRALSYDLGANSYLVKPVSFDGFLHTVKEIGEYWIVLNVKPPLNA